MIYILVFLLLITDIFTCSIFGYIGNESCKNIILNGLKKLEYRGYDSAGIAFKNNDILEVFKESGKLSNLVDSLQENSNKYNIGIGHTRWATHGEANQKNAHPQYSKNKSVVVVHNGIIENHFSLKEIIKSKKVELVSDTDTEVIPHLFSLEDKKNSIEEQTKNVVNKLEGSFAFLALIEDQDKIIAARKGSPMCIGIGEDCNYIASDALAFADKTNRVIYLPEKTYAIVSADNIDIYNFSGKKVYLEPQVVDTDHNTFDLTGYEHFMLKEIYEQPAVIRSSIEALQNSKNLLADLNINANNLKCINILGCGTSWHAARIAQFYFEEICKIPTRIYLASEFRYMPFFPEKDSLYIALSQSGETADTLEAIRLINQHNLQTLAITNVASSSLARECSGHILFRAGPEISVAATKSFTAQLTALYYLANVIGLEKKVIDSLRYQINISDIYNVADILQKTLVDNKKNIQNYAKKYCNSERFIFLGRHIGYPLAMEAALKLKEISYIFAMGYPAGELKHGSIALVDMKTPVCVFSHPDELIYQKILSNAQEVKSRNGHLISMAFEGQSELIKLSDLAITLPKVSSLLSPIAMSGIMQLFVYNIAKELGCNIDKPRNLAKSVTVE